MKKDIHPKIYNDCVVKCACGNTFTTSSTLPSISVDICSACHPFFTGKHKFVDVEGRIDKFEKKRKVMETAKQKAETLKKGKRTGKIMEEAKKQPTLKELLKQARSSE